MDKFTGMISKQELRVGNKVAVDNGRYIATVLTIRQNVMDVMYVDKGPYAPPLPEDGIHGYASWAYEHAGPIPLTPELLGKCGYRLNDGEWINEKSTQDGAPEGSTLTIEENSDGLYFIVCNDYYNGYEAKIDSLHQLQNLYYALTGQELELHL